MSFVDQLLGARGCNVDGTTSNNPIMRLTEQILDNFLPPQHYGHGSASNGGYEEGRLVSRVGQASNYQGADISSNQSPQHGQTQMSAPDQRQIFLENSWQHATLNPAILQQRMLMEQQHLAWNMSMQMQMQQNQQESQTQKLHGETGDLKDISNIRDGGEKERNEIEENDLQNLLEEAWNAEGIQGSSDDQKAFWKGLLQRQERGESVDAAWRAIHNYSMRHSWKPTDKQQDYKISTENSVSIDSEYSFVADNPYLGNQESLRLDSDELYNKGMEYYEDGHVDEAILAFEGALKCHPECDKSTNEDGGNVTAIDQIWQMLGVCHAEMDSDVQAIFCYREAVEYDPFNLNSLLALGTSYVNEMNPVEALKCLQSWVKHNPKFYGMESRLKKQYNMDTADDVYADGTLMDEVLQLMLAVAKFDPTDADVQIVLGVLQNVTQDLGAAVQAFQRALEQNPHDFSLLNKIGATLSNDNRSVEAIPYYAKALKIRPLYARGWLNLGIAYANLGKYDEAIKGYVQALAINPEAMHIWEYLESIFSYQRRYDLINLSQKSRDPLLLAEKLNFTVSTPLYGKSIADTPSARTTS